MNSKNSMLNFIIVFLSLTSMAMSAGKDFSGKVVLITGSSSGIGAKAAEEFSRAGAKVVITGRNANKLAEVGKQCLNVSPKKLKPLEVVADLTKEGDCKRLIDTTIRKFGKLDVLVNSAGKGGQTSVEDPKIMQSFDEMMNINVKPVVYLTHLSVKHLKKTKGNIINISSSLGLRPFPRMPTYSMAKSAVNMFTKTSALELAPSGIRVNAINPGITRTNFGAAMGMDPVRFSQMAEELAKDYPLGRAGDPIDIANAILFLASNDSSWVTGVNLSVDGGELLAPPNH